MLVGGAMSSEYMPLIQQEDEDEINWKEMVWFHGKVRVQLTFH